MKLNKFKKAAMTIEFVIVVSILVLIGCLGTSYVYANYDSLVGKANKVEDSIIVKSDGTTVGGGSENGETENGELVDAYKHTISQTVLYDTNTGETKTNTFVFYTDYNEPFSSASKAYNFAKSSNGYVFDTEGNEVASYSVYTQFPIIEENDIVTKEKTARINVMRHETALFEQSLDFGKYISGQGYLNRYSFSYTCSINDMIESVEDIKELKTKKPDILVTVRNSSGTSSITLEQLVLEEPLEEYSLSFSVEKIKTEDDIAIPSTFTIEGVGIFECERGMTGNEFIASSYNIDNIFTLSNEGWMLYNGNALMNEWGEYVWPEEGLNDYYSLW